MVRGEVGDGKECVEEGSGVARDASESKEDENISNTYGDSESKEDMFACCLLRV